MTTRRQFAEGVGRIAVALFLTFIIVPSGYQIRLPKATPVLNHSSTQMLYSTTGNQQAVPIQGGYQTPYTTLSHGADLMYSYIESQQIHFDPTVAVRSTSLNPGQNITFVVKPSTTLTQAQLSSMYLYVFVVDPEGLVVVTSPQATTLTIGTSNGQPTYYLQANAFYSTLANGAQGGVYFEWKTPNNNLSVGTWMVYAFTLNNQNPPDAVWGATAFSVQVSAVQSIGSLPTFLAWLGSFAGIYQAETSAINSYRKVAAHRKWLWDNGLWFVAAAAVLAFLYLAYFR